MSNIFVAHNFGRAPKFSYGNGCKSYQLPQVVDVTKSKTCASFPISVRFESKYQVVWALSISASKYSHPHNFECYSVICYSTGVEFDATLFFPPGLYIFNKILWWSHNFNVMLSETVVVAASENDPEVKFYFGIKRRNKRSFFGRYHKRLFSLLFSS